MTKHVHADVIHAYAEGKQIQFFSKVRNKWEDIEAPVFAPDYMYRVKPSSMTFFRSFDVYTHGVEVATHYKRKDDKVVSVVVKPGEQICLQITIQP